MNMNAGMLVNGHTAFMHLRNMNPQSPQTRSQLGASPGTHTRYFGLPATVLTLLKSEVNNGESPIFSELLFGGSLDGTGGGNPLELGEIVARWNELKPPSIANERNN